MPKVEVKKVATLEGHNDCIYTLSSSESDSEVISAAGDGMVVSWDLDNPKDGQLLLKTPNSIYSLHNRPKNKTLLVGQNFEGIHEINISTKEELRSLKLTTSEIFDIQSSEQDIYVGCKTGEVFVIDYLSFTIKKTLKHSSKSARCISVSDRHIAVGYSDNRIRVFDKEKFNLLQEIDAHSLSVFTIRYSKDYKYLVSGSRDAKIKFWDVSKNYSLDQSIDAHMYAINHIAFNTDGSYLFSCSMDKSIKVWDTDNRKLLKVIDKSRYAGHGTSINKIYWSDKKNQLVAASDDRTLTLWDITIN